MASLPRRSLYITKANLCPAFTFNYSLSGTCVTVAHFDGIEEGGIRASSSYSLDNEKAMEGLQDRVNLLKRVFEALARVGVDFRLNTDSVTCDVHEEVESHNCLLDQVENDTDASGGILSGTMDKFKMVFNTKSSRGMFTLVASFVAIFLVIYFLTS